MKRYHNNKYNNKKRPPAAASNQYKSNSNQYQSSGNQYQSNSFNSLSLQSPRFSMQNFNRQFMRRPVTPPHLTPEILMKKDKEIAEFKEQKVYCPICGELITDLPSSLTGRESGQPVHFECAMADASKQMNIGENEKICYIGHGTFALLHFDNPRDMRHFRMVKKVEWEEQAKTYEWKEKVCNLYSKFD